MAGLGDAWRVFAADLEADLAMHEQRVLAHAHRGLAPRDATFELLAEILRARPATDDNFHERSDPLS